MPSQSLLAQTSYPLYRLAHSRAANGLARICPCAYRTHGTPGASCTSTARPGPNRTLRTGRRSPPGPARGPMHRGWHDSGGTRRPDPLRPSQTTDAMLGAAPLRGLEWRAPPPGTEPPSRPSPCPACLGRGRRGLSIPRQGRSPPATASRTAPQTIPDSSGKAQGRLGKRSRRRIARGNNANPGVVAMAREGVGFMWAMATLVPVFPSSALPDGA
jgi:hypothetical protein